MDGPGAAYQRARVVSAPPANLVVMLYERLLADLKGAAAAMRAGDIEAKAKRVQHATDIVFELLGALDAQQGGEIAERLAALYTYMITRIGEASRAMDPELLDEISGHVNALAGAWRTVATEHAQSGSARPQ